MVAIRKSLQRVGPSFSLLVIISFGILHSFFVQAQPVPAQPKAAGSYLYERLSKTQKEYEAALARGDSLEVAELCYRLGKLHIGFGDYKTSQKYFIRSLKIREPLGPSEAIGKTYLFMSHHQIEQKKHDEALQTVRKAMANFNVSGSQHGLMSGYLAMAGVHELGVSLTHNLAGAYPAYSFDSILYYYQRAEKLALLLKGPSDLANIYYMKGLFLMKAHEKNGLAYIKKANTIFSKEKLPYPIINLSIYLSDAYLTLQQPAEAKKWLEKAQYIIDTAGRGDYQQQRSLFQTYTRLHEQTGNWQAALKAQKKYHELTVTALNADREGAIVRIGIEYETQKKEARLESQQRLITIVIALGLTAIIASIVFYGFFRKYKQLSLRNATLVMEQNHRVKNNFQEVINLLTLQANRLTNEEAHKAVMEGLLRMEAMALVHQRLYDNSDRLVEINISDFIPELVQGVLRSYNYSHIHTTYNLETIWLHVDQAVPLGLIINELMTNSCKHAFPIHNNPILSITCLQTEKMITLKIADNGPGFDLEKSYKSFGLKLVLAFTQSLNGQARLITEDNIFQLVFPIHTFQSIHLAR